MRGADLLVKTLSGLDVNRIFTLSGNQIMSVFDASIDENIDMLHFRHEAAAVYSADTFGRLTGSPGIALVTAGPGFANTLASLYVAMSAESPMVLLSGHSPIEQSGRGAFQEMAQSEMASKVTKGSWMVKDASLIGHDVVRAFQLARSGRPGPVHVALPFDVLESLSPNEKDLPNHEAKNFKSSLISDFDISEIMSVLRTAKRPLVLPGQAVFRQAGDALRRLTDLTGVPVVNMESPRGVNDPSLGAFAEIISESDLIVLLGKRLDFGLNFGDILSSNCKVVHVDHDQSAISQSVTSLKDTNRVIVEVHGDPLEILDLIIETTVWSADITWIEEVKTAILFQPSEWSEFADYNQEGPLHPLFVCRAIQSVLDRKESVFVSDGGEFGQWAQACISSQRRIINGPGGAIGGSIPAAIASRLVYRNATIIVALGDGTFGFHGMEFDTAIRNKLPFVAVVGNDARWNAEYQIQLREYGMVRTVGCELGNSRYDLVVQALGGHGENVTRMNELMPALHRALDSGLPACVNVSIQPIPAPLIRRSN